MLKQTILQFKNHNKILWQLATSGGKTFTFSNLVQYWIEKYHCKAIILCHREELVHQAIESLNQMGITCESVMPRNKVLKHTSQVYVGMIETCYRRLQSNPYFFQNVGLVISDEAHVQVFDKIYSHFPSAKILGVTATPVVMKRIKFYKCKYCKTDYENQEVCCDDMTDEWTKPFAMSSTYENIVVGPTIDKLIEKGSLVKELPFAKKYVDLDSLKTGSDGEITTESFDSAYSNEDAVFNVLLNYNELCKGKKTIIFNGSSKNNKMVYEKFLEAGLNVRMYDSVNVELSGNRKQLVDWFNKEDDAILLNVGCFVAGFNSKEVQAIILNVATNSLSQFIQMCGRGARATDKIYKDHFILVDGGGNIDRHLEFSDPTRDWKEIFFNGLGKPKAKKQDAFDIESCEDCGALYAKSEPSCPECGNIILPPIKQIKEVEFDENILTPIRKIPPPNANKIYEYTIRKGENINFAFKIMIAQYVDLFKFYRVTKETYEATLANGNLEKDVRLIIRKCYFLFISKPDIRTEGKRSIKYLVEKTLEKIKEYYYI